MPKDVDAMYDELNKLTYRIRAIDENMRAGISCSNISEQLHDRKKILTDRAEKLQARIAVTKRKKTPTDCIM
jgi:hypothetical protein